METENLEVPTENVLLLKDAREIRLHFSQYAVKLEGLKKQVRMERLDVINEALYMVEVVVKLIEKLEKLKAGNGSGILGDFEHITRTYIHDTDTFIGLILDEELK
jgi:hypothetical protein